MKDIYIFLSVKVKIIMIKVESNMVKKKIKNQALGVELRTELRFQKSKQDQFNLTIALLIKK